MIRHSCPTIGPEEIAAVKKVLQSKHIAQGEKVLEFEDKFKHYIGTKYAMASNSGTSALHLALLALGIRKTDEIILPSYVCTAVLNAVNFTGAGFRLADIDILDYNIGFQAVKKALTRRTKAIIVPHMFGQAAKIDDFIKLGIPVIEDCALSVGGEYKNRKLGSFGTVSIFSFYATKIMTTAEGGMALTNDKRIADRISDLRDYDEKDNYITRFNYKMTDLSAAIGIEQLRKLEAFIERRRKIAGIYNRSFSKRGIYIPQARPGARHIYSRYVMRLKSNKQEKFLWRLKRVGIECKKPIFKPLHRYLGFKDADFPNTALAYNTAVSIPLYPSLQDREVREIINVVKEKIDRL